MLIAIFCGHFNFGKIILSKQIFRIISRCLVVGCVIQIIVFQYIYMSEEAAPKGFWVSWPLCIWIFVGFIFWVPAFSFLMVILIEQPITRVYELTFKEYITHDFMLKLHYDIKHNDVVFEQD